MKTKLLLFLSVFSILIVNRTIAQNCPGYSTTVTSPSVTCGNQPYYFQIANTACNGTISFNVVGNYGSSFANEISWVVTSNLTGATVASGGPGSNNGVINVAVGPLNPAVTGNYFTLVVNDAFGDGFNGTGGTISISQSGSTIVGPVTGNFGAQSSTIFGANINISPITVTINTPTGPVTTVVNNCEPVNVPLTLQNNAFCSPTTINLPWTITCNSTGAVLASGTKAVTVYPKIPTSASDLVQVSWNSTTCSWNVSPQNGCISANIGTIFTISKNPSTLPAPVCGGGSQAFSVTYNGISGGPNCCSTGGPLVPITYTFTDNTPTAQSTPFGGVNNGALLTIPAANNNGGNATAVTLNVNMSGYCFNPPGTGTNTSYWVTIYQNNTIILDQQSVAVGPSNYSTTLNLTQIPGYNANSSIIVYIYPNAFNSTTGGVTTNTTFVQGIACPPSTDGNWTASSISATLSATYQNLTTSPASCVYPIAAQSYSCCPFTTVPNGTGVICSGGSLTSLTTWQSAVTAANANCVVYSSVTPVAGTTLPNNTLPDGINLTSSPLTQSVNAYSYCDVDGSGTINNGDTYSLISSFTLTVNPSNGITLTSAASSTNQTLCATNPITNITYTTTGATGATFTGLPTGVSGSWNNNTITISGTPTQTGTYNYTITLTGGCGSITANGTITILVSNTILLTSAAATTNQILCNTVAITNITYTTSGATGANFTGLPTGVSGTWNNNTITISGTPSQTGSFNYTVTLTGGCGTITATGTIIINPLNTITLTSAPGTTNQTLCSSAPTTSITYTTTGATGATFTGLPTGVNGNWSNNSITISGTPTQIGNYNYTITLTGGCGTITSTGILTITQGNTITLTSAVSTTNQIICSPNSITNITYTTTGATGATITGLPAGVTGSWSNNAITISGTPTQSGTFNYSILLSGGCGSPTASGTITINTQTIPNFNQIGAICSGGSLSLPSSSLNNISGVWSPPVNNLATTLYTFTPNTTECATTATMTITVNPNVTPTFNQVSPLCSGTGFVLPSISIEGVSGNWSPSINTSTTTNYTFTPTSAVCAQPANMSVTILPLPIVNAGNDLSLCAGAQATLAGSGAQTYSWTGGVIDLVSFIPNTTSVYTVTGTSVDGCIGTDQVNVTVNPIPTVNAGNDVTVCSSATVVLTGSGAANYSWNNGIQNGIAFTPPSGTTNYTVTGTSSAGCTSSDNVNVTVINSLNVGFTPDVTTGCSPLTVNFINNSQNGTNCVWNMGNGDVLNGCGNISYTFTNAQCYDISLTVTDAAGCVGTSTINNLICVESNPIASFIPSDYSISELNNIVQFNNNSTGASSYVWNFGDNSTISSLVNPLHTFPTMEEGTYTVTLTAMSDFGCIATSQALIHVFEELIYYVPNTFTPDNDNYNQMFKPIFTSGFDPYDYTLLIFDRWGEIIFESHDSEIGWLGTYGTNGEMKNVQDGTYSWTIEFKTKKTDERKVVRGHVNLIR
jgi:gliding motility-associated-like protein